MRRWESNYLDVGDACEEDYDNSVSTKDLQKRKRNVFKNKRMREPVDRFKILANFNPKFRQTISKTRFYV